MDLNRRSWLGVMGTLPLIGAAGAGTKAPASSGALVGRDEFPLDGVYLNGAYTHPLPVRSAKVIEAYLKRRTYITTPSTLPEAPAGRKLASERFAKLTNANVDEVILVPSTTYGENYVARGLGLGKPGTKVVSDILHFEGSLYLYESLAKGGMTHVTVAARDGRI
ncbi:MAG: hypothetical protein WCD42_10415, partial [Rhizomicrobium sp.]